MDTSTTPSRTASTSKKAGVAKPRVVKPDAPRASVSSDKKRSAAAAELKAESAASGAPAKSIGVDESIGAEVKIAAKARTLGNAARSAPGSVGRAAKGASARGVRVGVGAARGSARGVGRVFAVGEPAPVASDGEPVAGMTVKLPFVSGSLRLPGPGAVASVGPVRVTLPTGALYYGGLTALVIGGSLELPVAVGAALAGAVFGRRWLRGPVPEVSVYDATPESAPQSSSSDTPKNSAP